MFIKCSFPQVFVQTLLGEVPEFELWPAGFLPRYFVDGTHMDEHKVCGLEVLSASLHVLAAWLTLMFSL